MRIALAALAIFASALSACQSAPTAAPAATTAPAAKPTSPVAPAAASAVPASPAASPASAPSAVAVPSPSAAPVAAGPREKMVVAYAGTPPSVLSIFIAQDQGIFARNGLDVTIQGIPAGSSPLAALLSGEVNVMYITAETIAARLGGADVKYIAAPLPSPLFYLYARSQVSKIEDLPKGVRVGVTGAATATESAAIYLLNKHGFQKGDYATANTGSTPNTLAALQSGQIDAAILSTPSTLQAQQVGFHQVGDAVAEGWAYPGSWASVSSEYARSHHDTVLRFVKSQVEGEALASKDKALAIRVLGQAMKLDDAAALDATYQDYVPHFLKVPDPPDKGIQAALDQLATQMPAAASAKPADFVDREFVQQLQADGTIDNAWK